MARLVDVLSGVTERAEAPVMPAISDIAIVAGLSSLLNHCGIWAGEKQESADQKAEGAAARAEIGNDTNR